MIQPIDDTIAAVSSPAGYAARGIVRLSGPRALEIASAVFRDGDPRLLSERPAFWRYRGEVTLHEGLSAPADLYLFRAPHSYTRQDLVEFHTVGSPALLAMVVEVALERGARPAEPGEFTARAFLQGAMNLAEAESVAAVIRAQSDAQLRAARRFAEGEVVRQTVAWMERLAEITALVEADIDFAEEPIEFITPSDLRERLDRLRGEIDALVQAAESTERFDVLPTVLLVGPANAGKSSLMNALSGMDRAICSAVAGTTRDILTAPASLPGMDCLLLDGAGLTQTDDELIQAAQAMIRATAARVDLLCLVVDVATGFSEAPFDVVRHHRDRPAVIAANKADLVGPTDLQRSVGELQALGLGAVVATSARTCAGIDVLKSALRDALGYRAGGGEDRAVLLSVRQRQALLTASAALERAAAEASEIRETIDRADLIAFELREALDAVGSICGGVTTEDLLGQVFANFCIGK